LQTKAAPKARTKKEEKQVIEIDGRFDRPFRGRGGDRGGDRGGRGFDRGGRGRGEGRGRGGEGRGRGGFRGGRGGANGAAAHNVKLDDESAFPSLS
jgi:plasminogen activator inhibitor 1 RNA-binding protein